jgi:ribosomal protein S18 acetylase RimI-like enzyme
MHKLNGIVKILNQSHWEQYKQIRLESLQKFPQNFLSSLNDERKLSEDYWRQSFLSYIRIGYFLENETIAICSLSIEKNIKIAHTAMLSNMYVKPKFHGSKVALELINFAKCYCAQQQISQIYLGCSLENIGAIKFYKKCGFKIYGVKPNYLKEGDKYIDDLIMMCEV